MPLQPGKNGVHTSILNLNFLRTALEELESSVGESQRTEQSLPDTLAELAHWHLENDEFGHKAYTNGPDGKVRVTVVVRKGTTRIDIREWYEPGN